mgnify:CR=1 FL=1
MADPRLHIDAADKVSSGEYFTVSVFDPSLKNTTPYLVNVLIIFNNKEYVITEEDNGEITLLAPQVVTNTTYMIEAYKGNYLPGFKNITVMPAKHNYSTLVITLKSFTVDANEKFLVIVTDEEGNPIEDATVRIENFTGKGTSGFTDKNGYAYLIAPNVDEITILAQKDGYNNAVKKLMITTIPTGLNGIIQDPHTPLIIAAAFLLIAIIYVYLKNRGDISRFYRRDRHPLDDKTIEDKTITREEFSKEKNMEFYPIKIESRSKVEEIHITKPRKEGKIIKIDEEEDFPWFDDKSSDKEDTQKYSDIQKEIDTITSKINERETWFEGVDEIREKIDKKLKKYKQ